MTTLPKEKRIIYIQHMQNFLESLIIYKDDAIIVINKPDGIAVHSGRGGGENLEKYLCDLCFGYETPPIPAHRLDRDTSGCLILGRTKEAISKLGKIFMSRRIIKTYWAVVEGRVAVPEGRIEIPLRKQSQQKHNWWMEAHGDGQEAITDYKVIGQGDGCTLLELRPLTGRTHQLRVHCKAIGHPIIGDKIYGSENGQPLHLHARSVAIPFYHNQPPLVVVAEAPDWANSFLKPIT